MPFQRLEEICSRHAVRADVAFNYLTVNRRPSRGPGFDVTGYRQRLNSNFPIGVNVMPSRETQIEVSCDPSVFDAAAIDRMLDQWREVLTWVPDPERTVGAVTRAAAGSAAAARARAVERRRRDAQPAWMMQQRSYPSRS